jgi:primosomal protein DnaI
MATKFITSFKEETKGIYLNGFFGVGKTYLLAATANELSKRGINVILAYFPDLVREIKNNMTNGTKLEEILNTLKTVDVLMLDDFGSENLSSWLRDDILGPIINYRYEAKKPICISSNLNSNQLLEHLSQTNDGKDDLKGMRLMKRIMSLTNELTLGSDSEF